MPAIVELFQEPPTFEQAVAYLKKEPMPTVHVILHRTHQFQLLV